MYISQLYQVGYTIVYKISPNKNALFGISTLEKIIFLYNISPDNSKDWTKIEDLLYQADCQYSFVWKEIEKNLNKK